MIQTILTDIPLLKILETNPPNKPGITKQKITRQPCNVMLIFRSSGFLEISCYFLINIILFLWTDVHSVSKTGQSPKRGAQWGTWVSRLPVQEGFLAKLGDSAVFASSNRERTATVVCLQV